MFSKIFKNLITIDGVDGAGSSSISFELKIQLESRGKKVDLIYVPELGKLTWALEKLRQFQQSIHLTDSDNHPGINRGYLEIVDEVYQSQVLPKLDAGHIVLVESGDVKSIMHVAEAGYLAQFRPEIEGSKFTTGIKPRLRVLLTAPPRIVLKVMRDRDVNQTRTNYDPRANLSSVKSRIESFNQAASSLAFEKKLGVIHMLINNDRTLTQHQIAQKIIENFI